MSQLTNNEKKCFLLLSDISKVLEVNRYFYFMSLFNYDKERRKLFLRFVSSSL